MILRLKFCALIIYSYSFVCEVLVVMVLVTAVIVEVVMVVVIVIVVVEVVVITGSSTDNCFHPLG